MRIVSVLLFFLTVFQKCSQQNRDTTLDIHQRVALLKHKIAENIKKNSYLGDKILPIAQDPTDTLEYEDEFNAPITPINENDERKKQGKFMLRQLKTKSVTPWMKSRSTRRRTTPMKKAVRERKKRKPVVADDWSTSSEAKPALLGIDHLFLKPKRQRLKSLRLKELGKAGKGFYRRIYTGLNLTCAKQIVHCQELITPFLAGTKTNISAVKSIKYSDHTVIRLVQLINEDTSGMSKEEIYSILYQISNLQVRLFQWELSALKLLLKTITHESVTRHSFRSLKHGIKAMLARWHLDYQNITSLLQQTRLFRPPCMQGDTSESSTLSSHVVRYYKSTKKKCSIDTDSSSCET